MATDTLSSIADQLLDHATDALDQAEVVEAVSALNAYSPGAPDRVFVSHGEPASDCGQLTVHMTSVAPQSIGAASIERCAVVPQARFCVRLQRCVTAVDEATIIPGTAVLNAEAMALLIEGWALWKYLTRLWATGALLDGIACKNLTWGTLEPLGPEGGLAGWQVCATVQV